jgi:shikimate kinase
MMGAGKTSVGRRLAARLGWPFHDSDAEIEIAARMSVSDIFDRLGEAHFRDGERRVIARLMRNGRTVLATGGGAFVDPATRALILAQGTAVWLDAGLDVLVERVRRRATRPLLANRDPRMVLEELLAARAPCYAQAHLRVESRRGPHDDIVIRILDQLEPCP